MMRVPALVALLASCSLPCAHAYMCSLPASFVTAQLRSTSSLPLRSNVGIRQPRAWGLFAATMQRNNNKPPPPRESEFNDGRGPYEKARQKIAETVEIPYGPEYFKGIEHMGDDWTRRVNAKRECAHAFARCVLVCLLTVLSADPLRRGRTRAR